MDLAELWYNWRGVAAHMINSWEVQVVWNYHLDKAAAAVAVDNQSLGVVDVGVVGKFEEVDDNRIEIAVDKIVVVVVGLEAGRQPVLVVVVAEDVDGFDCTLGENGSSVVEVPGMVPGDDDKKEEVVDMCLD